MYDIFLLFGLCLIHEDYCRSIHPGSGQNERNFRIDAICVTFIVSTFTMFVF